MQATAITVAFAFGLLAARADLLETQDGHRYTGQVRLTTNDVMEIQVSNQVHQVPLARLKSLRLGTSLATATNAQSVATANASPDPARLAFELLAIPAPGVLTRTGCFIAKPISTVDGTRVTFKENSEHLALTTINTAAIFFRPLSFAEASQLRAGRVGVLLKSGDFVGGEQFHVQYDRVTIQSILFGSINYATGREAAAIFLQMPTPPPRPYRYAITTKEGSHLLAEQLHLDQDALRINEGPFHDYRVPWTSILNISAGRPTNVLIQAWARWEAMSAAERKTLLASADSIEQALEKRREAQRKAAEAQVQQARKKWERAKGVWTQKKRESDRIKNDVARAKNQVQSRERQLADILKLVNRNKATLEQQQQKAAQQERELAQTKQTLDRVRHEKGDVAKASSAVNNALRAKQRADQAVSRAKSQYERYLRRSRDAEKSRQSALDQERKQEERAAAAQQAANQAQAEAEALRKSYERAKAALP